MAQLKIVVEQHSDGYIAYPLGIEDIIAGRGETHDLAVADVTSAIREYFDRAGSNEQLDSYDILDATIGNVTLVPRGQVSHLSQEGAHDPRAGAPRLLSNSTVHYVITRAGIRAEEFMEACERA